MKIKQQNLQNQDLQELNTTIVFILIQYSEQRVISAAIFNNVTRSFQITTFLDNQHYVNLESFLIQVNPKENDAVFKVILQIPQINSERKKILSKVQDLDTILKNNKAISHNNILSIIQPKLKFLLKNQTKYHVKELQNKLSILALDLLLNQLELEKQKSNRNQFNLSIFENGSYMKLDKACLNALNIFSKNMQKKILSNNSTLYDILNKCKTNFGTRCLKRWMKQPLQNKQKIQQRLDLLEYFVQNQSMKNIIQNQLKKLPDLQKIYYIFYKVESGKKYKCDVSELIKLHRIVTSVKDLIENIEKKGINDKFIQNIHKQLVGNHTVISKLSKMIEQCIDMGQSDRPSEWMVKAEAQPNLAAIKKSMNEIHRNIADEKKKVQQFLKSDIQMADSATYKFVFECNKKGLVQKVKDTNNYKFITAKQTKMTFSTDHMIKYCNSLMALEQQYKEQQQQVLNKMFKIVAGYYPVMQKLSSILSQLDVIIGWSTIISTSSDKWEKPVFGQKLNGVQIRHPCVKNCIPNNINIENKKTIILTGPNMGGKSTYIRTIGVCTYLAHIGMFVPATYFETPVIDNIICRVGASDQQVKGISTFMSQMIQTSCMLKTSTNKSLVLIDELGRGTSTNEGFGLSWALCKYLHTQINPYCLFATHFHEMIKIEDQVEGIANMYTSCKIIQDKLQFQYRVFQGKVEKSYGIQVAKMLSFPKQIIEEAESFLEVYENKQEGKKFDLNPQQEEFIGNLVDQMNGKLQNCKNNTEANKIRNNYYDQIRVYLKN